MKFIKIISIITICLLIETAVGCSLGTAEEIFEKITPGMTYREICDIVGSKGTDKGSGAIIYEWELDNGKTLKVWFYPTNGENLTYPDDLISNEKRLE